MTQNAPDVIVRFSSPRPWSYHNDGSRDWIEDAKGDTVVRSIGHLDGPLIVACVNYATACGTDEEAITENRICENAGINISARLKHAKNTA